MVNGRVWIVVAATAAVACAALAACGREDVAQPAREHGLTDEAAAGPLERAVIEAQRPSRRADSPPTNRGGAGAGWADSRRYTAEENASYQFQQHGEDLRAKDVDDFVAKARRFVNNPPDGAKTLVRANGDKLIYDPESGLFGVARSDGAPRTVFKPADGDAYWAQQVKTNGAGTGTARRTTRDSDG